MATWNDNAITDVGLELLEHTLTAGKTLTLSRAAVGGGHVESAELKDQTELLSVLADVTVLIAEQLRLEGSSGIQIKLQIRNDGITSACTYKQVGIYATDGETEVLFAIYQDANGEEIPSETDYPDFMEIFTAVIALSQTYNVNVTVSSLAYVTKEELNSGLGGKADIEHTHTTSNITDYKEPCNPNLLINPDFLVNQRGQNEYSSGYTVDGWYIEGNKCSVRPSVDGILITSAINVDSNSHAFWQKIENPLAPGKYTLSLNVLEVSGVWSARIRTVNASGDYVDSYYTSAFREGVNKVSVDLSEGEYISAVSVGFNKGTEAGNSLKLTWVKLEAGSAATPFVPPDPATELLKCQRYLFVLPQWSRWRMCEYTSKFLRFEIPTPIKMRIKPTLINSENFVIRSIDIVNELDGFTYEADNYAGNELLIKAIKDSHDITDGVIVASNGNVLLSAEL
jgi:hypothetical protein|nr:MAG TPA: tail-collar fiber protein [Caudoviricetes sp.]